MVAGAAYHVEGVDLGAEGKITDKWSVYTGLVLMKNRVDASGVPTNVGLPLAFIANQSFNVLTIFRSPTPSMSAARRPIGRKSMAVRCWQRTRAPCFLDYWRFDAFLEGKVTQNWRWRLFADNIFNKLYYDAFHQSAWPFVLVAPGRVVGVRLSARF